MVVARSGEAAGTRGLSALVVDADPPGLSATERIEIIAPHPMATLRFTGCRVPAGNLLGAAGEGFKIAMRNLDVFRSSVAAAALGLSRRAMDESLQRVRARRMFGQTLADFQMTQAKLADMAKLHATESAQQVIDAAVQLFGGLGVVSGHPVERLYREVRALRIYEGATEVQKPIIARELLKDGAR